MTRQIGKEVVHKLIKDFENNETQYMSKNFQETEARKLFIDPFFTALGWEFHQTGIAKKFWDVHLEVRQRVNSTTKKPDYAFRVKEGVKFREKFFVEAKAPHVDLAGKNPVFQAKRYAFSSHGKTPIVILTDFQTFRVFNGLEKPIFENPDRGLIKELELEYHAYLDTWDTIWDSFSKDAVTEGSIDRLACKVNRNVKSLDDEFLDDISAWRKTLAKSVAIKNLELSEEQINEAVQRILDRLIFIRNLEDREIESEDSLFSMLDIKENIYPHLIPRFRGLNDEYNGLLFKEHFSEGITVADTVIKDIVKQLYPPISPYAFDMIEPEILGRIYERFLGSKIRLTDNHQAKVEEKPEVKKAGGVYYTPQYIVDYIVENTVGVKIKDKTPEEIAEIKICDPACGSGSFLLGAFQYLIEYHRDWYAKASQTTQKKYKDDFYNTAENEIQLSLKKKTEILKNNIFGVDIDREATEVAIMSLYLKILDEGYDKGQIELFMRGHILPDMKNNIKCGNSLIGTDFYNQGNLELGDDNLKKVNCFDWDGKDGFAEIFKKGGFDIVIGNPPYVRPHNIEGIIKEYFWEHLKTFVAKSDMYNCFMEKGINLVKEQGLFGFIVPHNWTSLESFTAIRKYVLESCLVVQLVQLPKKVFADATVETCIFIFQKKNESKNHFINIFNVDKDKNVTFIRKLLQNDIQKAHLYNFQLYGRDAGYEIIEKIKNNGLPLGNYVSLVYGFKTADDEKFISSKKINKDYKLFIRSADIFRYGNIVPNEYVWYVPDIMIKNRQSARPGEIDRFISEKIIVARMGKELIASYDSGGLFVKDAMLLLSNGTLSLKYLLALLNSRLLNYYYQEYFNTIDVLKNALLSMPIVALNLSQKSDKVKHDDLVSLVDKMLDLKKKEVAELSDHQKTVITRQIDTLDKAIDTAVYELYNLTADEIKVVEGKE